MNMQDVPESELQKAQRLAVVEALAVILADKRSDAINGRRESGIEQIWAEDTDHYEGRDDATDGTTRKGRTANDGITEQAKKSQTRSTAFLNITRPYCDAASASLSDMLLPTDDRNWDIRLTPLSDLKAALQDSRPVDQVIPQAVAQKQGGIRGAIGKMFGQQQPGQQPAPVPTVAEVAKQEMDRSTEALDAARTQIDDWLVECRYHAEVRKQIESASRLGTGVLKGPVPVKVRSRKVTKGEQGWMVDMVETIKPQSKSISPWKLYPDPACGDNIHNGSYVFEEDEITARKLMDLKGTPGYISEMIDLCIEEGPASAVSGSKTDQKRKTQEKDLFQIWYFHGQVSSNDMEAAGCTPGKNRHYPCQVTMVNDRIIKVALSPLDSGELPYDVMVWAAREDHWAGTGVARQMRTCQKGANAAVRNLMDNAGLSAGPQIVVDRNKVVPANGKWEITPRKVWFSKDAADVGDVRTAFIFVVVPMLQRELMEIIQFWLKESEDVTGMPALLQGQQGKAPETVGGMTILNNNASTVKRRIARTFDDRVTEPHISRYYEYLLLHGQDNAKGDFTIDARGSSALIERDSQSQQMPLMLQMSVNPAFGLDPESVMKEMLQSMRFDTKRLMLSDEKKEQMAKQPPQPMPQVQVAQIREEGANKRKEMELKAKAEQGDAERGLAQAMKAVDEKLALQDLSAQEARDLNQHKVDLASLSLKLKTQKELSPGPQVSNPAVEPPGRARDGFAYPE